MPKILFEDKFIIVCIKPCGVSSEVTSSGNDMPTLLSDYRADRGEDDYIGVVHRLDMAVGGIMVYTKRNDTAAALSKQMADGEFGKEYLAIAEGHTDDEGKMEDLLFHDKSKNKTYVVDRERKGVHSAALEYSTLARTERDGKEYSLVKIKLLTGKTHQIRVQFASRKLPLLGDGKYGASNSNCPIALWSRSLSFKHPKHQKTVTFSQEPDDSSMPWCLFK